MGTNADTASIAYTLSKLHDLMTPLPSVYDMQAKGWVTIDQIAEEFNISVCQTGKKMRKLISDGLFERQQAKSENGKVCNVYRAV